MPGSGVCDVLGVTDGVAANALAEGGRDELAEGVGSLESELVGEGETLMEGLDPEVMGLALGLADTVGLEEPDPVEVGDALEEALGVPE